LAWRLADGSLPPGHLWSEATTARRKPLAGDDGAFPAEQTLEVGSAEGLRNMAVSGTVVLQVSQSLT